jgi:hypothetical protein
MHLATVADVDVVAVLSPQLAIFEGRPPAAEHHHAALLVFMDLPASNPADGPLPDRHPHPPVGENIAVFKRAAAVSADPHAALFATKNAYFVD